MKFYRTCKETGTRTELSFAEAKEKIENQGWDFSGVIETCKTQKNGKLTLQGSFAYYDLEVEIGEG